MKGGQDSAPRPFSLATRLALIAAAGSAIALFLAALLFVSLFRASVEGSFDNHLQFLLRSLVGSALTGEGLRTDGLPEIGDPRFNLPQSNWYWQVAGEDGTILSASPSLIGNELRLPPEVPAPGEIRIQNVTGPDDHALRVIEQTIRTGGDVYRVTVAGDAAALATDVSRFALVVGVAVGALGLLLAFGALLLVRYGLSPLRDLRHALRRVRLGQTTSLEGAYPAEISPLVADLNALIASNREIVERARTHVGNLAHALKTPLSVLRNEAEATDAPLGAKVREQTDLMRAQVDHHLNRARMAAQVKVLGAVTPVAPVAESLARVMRKVHGDRGIQVDAEVPPGLRFRGERQDLEEMVGNLLDNACKWAATRVRLSAAEREGAAGAELLLLIEDDGPGLPPEQRDQALARGTRLDETRPGTGLGLSIVSELSRLYRGSIALEASPVLGGLKAELVLPAAADA